MQKRIYLSVPHMEGHEVGLVRKVFNSNWLSTAGPDLEALESAVTRRLGIPALGVSSCTAAIHLGLRLLRVGPNDEVLTPTLTFVGSCNPILYQGGKPIFIDSDPTTWNLDPNLLSDLMATRARQNRLPKAIIVVHLFGQSADMEPILSICARYDVPVLEDAANALGATYHDRPVGTFGDVGVYSLGGNKIITCSAGGLLVSSRKEWVDKACFWSTQARDPDSLHNYVHSEVGYNYRLSNALAAIARGQLDVLPLRIEQRRAVAFRYRDGLAHIPGIEIMPQAPYGLHTNWLSCFLIDEKRFGLGQPELIRFLDAANIETRPVWKPMHTQKLYQSYECVGGAVAEDLHRRGICLPSSSNLSLEDQQFVIDRIREAHLRATGR